MIDGFNESWLKAYYARRGIDFTGNAYPKDLTEEPPSGKRPKYGNVKTTVDGIAFDSKHEAERYQELRLMEQAGEIRGIALQVPFRLPGGVLYKADFVVLLPDGTYRVEDAKSVATRKDKVYRIKRRLMRECMGINIVEV